MAPQAANDREHGREQLTQLCEDFAENLAYYKSAEFDETTNRQRFIDPFFAALGWDVADEQRRGPTADVILEVPLRRGHQQARAARAAIAEEEEDERVADALAAAQDPGAVGVRRPDYSFRVGGWTRFLVEAKRPSVEINSPRPIYQVKTYGWNADIPIALLTDFEELLAFDCRYQPLLSEPQTGLIPEFALGYRAYVKNWDLLWDTFSREAVAGGSLARFELVKAEKGQLPVDVVFLGDLARWRQMLARDLARNNRGLAKLTGPDMWEAFDNSIRDLPIRRIRFEDATERRTHDDIVRLVKGIEEASVRAREGPSASDQSIAARRIQALSDQLDGIAFDLYGVTDEEERENVLALGAPR
jgi:type I restriction and modification enzyme subunit R-like protein